MKPAIRMLLATLFVLILAAPPSGHAQTKTQKTSSTGAAPSETDIQKKTCSRTSTSCAGTCASKRLKSWA
jgi:hypothetical protein